jgi:PAS domain S-box-containing protein
MAQGKITFFQEEIRMKAKDGSWKWILDTGKLLEVDADGKGLRAVGIHQDITDLRETEQDLLRVKELLEQTNRAARVGGWEIDFENRTVYWSDITREIHQIGPDYQDADTFEGILAQRFAFYKEGESRERIQQAIASAAAQGSSFDEELQLVTALGKEIWVRVVGKAIQLKGKVAKIYGAIYDISPLKKAANELEKKLTILKQAEAIANMGSWEYNFVENTLFWSDEVYKICGYEPRAFEVTFEIGMSVIHPDDQPHTVKTFEHTIATGAPYNMEKRFVRPDGSIRFINSRGRLVYDDKGKPFSLIGIFLDITEQKQITQQLEQLIDTTKSQNNRLIEYTHITSHNLRSPVARLMGLCALLTSDPSNQQYLNMVTQSANDLDSMIRLLNDLLDIENEVAYEEKMLVPLLPIIENNVNSLVPTCPDPLHIDIQVPPELSVSVIPLYLESIVHNLVSNAIKYRKSNQACSIVIQAHNHDDFVCLTISDNGIGINMEQHGDRLFKLKSRLSNYAEGKGIGLFFTKRQVEAMGGRIEVESQPGMGTTFKVYFSQRDVQIDDPE